MPTKRQVLDVLTRNELLELAERFELTVPDRQVKDQLIDAIGRSHRASLAEVLPTYPRDRLKELCAGLGLDNGGREKAPLVERLVGTKAAATVPTDGAGQSSLSYRFGVSSLASNSNATSGPPPTSSGGRSICRTTRTSSSGSCS